MWHFFCLMWIHDSFYFFQSFGFEEKDINFAFFLYMLDGSQFEQALQFCELIWLYFGYCLLTVASLSVWLDG